jgi:hypothetical protein
MCGGVPSIAAPATQIATTSRATATVNTEVRIVHLPEHRGVEWVYARHQTTHIAVPLPPAVRSFPIRNYDRKVVALTAPISVIGRSLVRR